MQRKSRKAESLVYYVIMVKVGDEEKYLYNSKLLVSNKGFARKFYSLSYARRYLKTHPNIQGSGCEIISCSINENG